MSVWKKIVAGVVVTALIAGAGAGGLNYMKKSRIKEAIVVPVESLALDYYSEDTILDGTVTTNVSQRISMDKDMVVEDLYVNQGDAVKVGDPLVSFDMTLVNMELEIAKLKQQKLELDLQKAQKRLNSLKNGGPIDEDTDGLNADSLSYGSNEDLASSVILDNGIQMASIFRPFFLAAVLENAGDFGVGEGDEAENVPSEATDSHSEVTEPSQEHMDQQPDNANPDGENPENPNEESPDNPGGTGEGELPSNSPDQPEAADPSYLTGGGDGSDIDFTMDDSDFAYTNPTFYQVLDDKSEPYIGSGTEDDPFLFLCSSATGEVTAMGSFLNKMAGFSADGAKVLHEGGYWYLLEFHDKDVIADTRHREDSCTGYYLIDGGMLKEPTSMFAEVIYTLADALQYEGEPEEPTDLGTGDDAPVSSMSRQEAIKLQETRVRSLELDIEEGLINIRKLEKKTENQIVYSRLDGTVASVGDPITGSSSSDGTFLTVKSKEGYFVKGNISELLLDQVEIGSKLDCTGYPIGKFSAKIVDVSDYPENSDQMYFFGGDSNPNVSYYSFSATVDDQSLQLTDGDWVQINLKTDASKSGKLVIAKAFVRSENGMNYVYKDEDGVLKKQYIRAGQTLDGGYSVMILGGLSRKDMLAFPYGDAKEGAPTRQGTEDDLYEQ